MYRHASLASLSGAVGHTAEERLDILENRDRIIRAGMSLFVVRFDNDRKRNCEKVMFSQVSVCSQGWGISGPRPFPEGGGYPWYQVPFGRGGYA